MIDTVNRQLYDHVIARKFQAIGTVGYGNATQCGAAEVNTILLFTRWACRRVDSISIVKCKSRQL